MTEQKFGFIIEVTFKDAIRAIKEELTGERDTRAQYISILYKKKMITVRKLRFFSYYSFILTDFYEGLHYGHYPRRCLVCGRYRGRLIWRRLLSMKKDKK